MIFHVSLRLPVRDCMLVLCRFFGCVCATTPPCPEAYWPRTASHAYAALFDCLGQQAHMPMQVSVLQAWMPWAVSPGYLLCPHLLLSHFVFLC